MKKCFAQLFSDCHLELLKGNRFPRIQPRADYLFLAGDIGNIYSNPENYKEFFNYCSQTWKKIFYVLGNHEFYYSNSVSITTIELFYEKFFQNYNNVFLLNNAAAEICDDVFIYGTTLWTTPVPVSAINDYNHLTHSQIYYNSRQQREKLLKFLAENNKSVILLTHFPPTQHGTSHPKYSTQQQLLKDYFAWKPEEIFNAGAKPPPNLENIKLWCSGHTHYSYNIKISLTLEDNTNVTIPCISNQIGYLSETTDTNFDEDGMVEGFEINSTI